MSQFKYQLSASYERFATSKLPALGIQVHLNEEAKPFLTPAISSQVDEAMRNIIDAILRSAVAQNEEIQCAWVEERVKMIGLFTGQAIYVEHIRNEYAPNDWGYEGRDWLLVTTRRGRIKIGWRKRVMQIDWSGSEIKTSAKDLFKDVDAHVTREDRYVHAWDYPMARKFIERIMNAD